MSTPRDCKCTESHEWVRVEGDTVTLGITQFAVDQLTDVTYVDLPSPGASFDAGDAVAEVESVKATSDVYSPVAGEVIEVNEALDNDPSLMNQDPFDKGWLIKFRVNDTSPLDSLMDAETYDKQYQA